MDITKENAGQFEFFRALRENSFAPLQSVWSQVASPENLHHLYSGLESFFLQPETSELEFEKRSYNAAVARHLVQNGLSQQPQKYLLPLHDSQPPKPTLSSHMILDGFGPDHKWDPSGRFNDYLCSAQTVLTELKRKLESIYPIEDEVFILKVSRYSGLEKESKTMPFHCDNSVLTFVLHFSESEANQLYLLSKNRPQKLNEGDLPLCFVGTSGEARFQAPAMVHGVFRKPIEDSLVRYSLIVFMMAREKLS
jgi:hypothetical protein